jgi:glutamate synthase (NADPH/NADH) large chain
VSLCWIVSKLLVIRKKTLKPFLSTMAQNGEEATGSMGNDSPLAVMSDQN